jgi:hypothetical protein
MIGFSAPGVAVLSQNSQEHLQDLRPADRAPLDQADHHPHIGQQKRAPTPGTALRRPKAWRRREWRFALRGGAAALLVEVALLPFSLGSTVIRDTAKSRLPLAVSSLAAKWTTQVLSASITRINEEKDATMPAPDQASPQERFGSQHRSQDHVILQDQSGYRLSSIPLRRKLEMLRDLACKKATLSLWMLTYSETPSSCQNDTLLSRQDEALPLKLRPQALWIKRSSRPPLPINGTIYLIVYGTILVSAIALTPIVIAMCDIL